MDAWLEWARGPAFVFCFSFMVLGLIRHVALTVWETTRTLRRAGDPSLPLAHIARTTLAWLFPRRAVGPELLFTATAVLFHAAMLIVPVFLSGHVVLWTRSTGLAWPALPNAAADVLTLVAVAAAGALAVRRITAKASRAISRPSDYALLVSIALPFVTGFLVQHPGINPFGFEPTLFLHVMSGNLVFILLPTTTLAHAVLLPGARLVAEVGWHWPADSGSQVGRALGKEAERV